LLCYLSEPGPQLALVAGISPDLTADATPCPLSAGTQAVVTPFWQVAVALGSALMAAVLLRRLWASGSSDVLKAV